MNVEPRFLTGEGPQIFTGNEALLKGALETEGGVHYLGGYPGSPIAGFFDAFAVIKDLLNEKGIRAVINNNEALAAAALNGTQTLPIRAMIVFKSVGAHVAADALALASLSGAMRTIVSVGGCLLSGLVSGIIWPSSPSPACPAGAGALLCRVGREERFGRSTVRQ